MRSVLSWPAGWEQLALANHQLLRCWVPLFSQTYYTCTIIFFQAECFYWRDIMWLLCQQLLSFKPGWITLPPSQLLILYWVNLVWLLIYLPWHYGQASKPTDELWDNLSSWCAEQCSSSGSLHIPLGRETPLTTQRYISAKITTYKNHIKRGAGN